MTIASPLTLLISDLVGGLTEKVVCEDSVGDNIQTVRNYRHRESLSAAWETSKGAYDEQVCPRRAIQARRFGQVGVWISDYYASKLKHPYIDGADLFRNSDTVFYGMNFQTGQVDADRFRSLRWQVCPKAGRSCDYDMVEIKDFGNNQTVDSIDAREGYLRPFSPEHFFEVCGRDQKGKRRILDRFQSFFKKKPDESTYSFKKFQIAKVYVEEGKFVKKGEPLFDLIIGKRRMTIRSDHAGRVENLQKDHPQDFWLTLDHRPLLESPWMLTRFLGSFNHQVSASS